MEPDLIILLLILLICLLSTTNTEMIAHGKQSVTNKSAKYTDILSQSQEYDYSATNGPASWSARFESCGRLRQSPIELNDFEVVHAVLPELQCHGHWDYRDEGFVLQNTWHTVEVKFSGPAPTLRGGPLSAEYVLSQIHFHWGGNHAGSEHSVNFQHYGMEMHLVHYKTHYGSIVNASEVLDGIAVVAVFFKVTEESNPDLEQLVLGLEEVRGGGAATVLSEDAMFWLRLHLDTQHYYVYQGSLTTPPCSEIVTWIVMRNPAHIGASQVVEFQKVQGHDGAIMENRRPVQLIHGRQVFYCSTAAATLEHVAVVASSLGALALLVFKNG